jgi:hypothetical protein
MSRSIWIIILYLLKFLEMILKEFLILRTLKNYSNSSSNIQIRVYLGLQPITFLILLLLPTLEDLWRKLMLFMIDVIKIRKSKILSYKGYIASLHVLTFPENLERTSLILTLAKNLNYWGTSKI